MSCKYSFPLTGPEKKQMGLTPVTRWGLCLHAGAPLKGEILVCSCKGCGPSCPGYVRDPSAPAEPAPAKAEAGVPKGGGAGVVVIGNDDWTRATVKLIRRLGCAWPIQVWVPAGETPLDFARDADDVTVLDAGAHGSETAEEVVVRHTNFDQVVLVPRRAYPFRPPCRLERFFSLAALVTFDGADGPLLCDRTRADGSHTLVPPPRRVDNGLVYHLGGVPSFVRVPDGEPSHNLPGGSAFCALLEEVRRAPAR